MGFSNQERINLNAKALQAGVLDGNASAVWYETFFPFGFILGSESVFTQMAALRALPASNLATAQTNATNNPTLLQDKSAVANAVRLTLVAGTNQTTYAAYTTYNDTTSVLLENWLLPQLIPQTTGAPSNGYAVRLFNGDPNAGGTEITTTDGTTGTGINKTVGWIWNYARGLLLLSSDFFTETGITPGTFNPYVLGFRYIGTTAGSSEASTISFTALAGENLVAGDTVRFDTVTNPGRVLKAQANSPTNGDVCGIVKDALSTGASATVYTVGSVPILFQSTPAASNNGSRVYLDPANAGKATLAAPSTPGQSVFLLGRLVGGDGADSTPSVILALQEIATLS
jgi:hypothetical protein